MKILFLISITSFLIYSCANVNTDSREYYKDTKAHGFVPLEILTTVGPYSSKITFDKTAAKRGSKLYVKHCLECHGKDGKGSRNGANLINKIKKVPNFQFFISVSQWKEQMPGWAKNREFSEEELVDITHYLKKLALK